MNGDQAEQPEAASKAAAESRAKILEGVDFIETEEDAEAVESAVVKIQSTFRGKKIRSKLGGGGAQSSKAAAAAANSASAATKGEEASTAAAAATQSSAEGQSASATNTNSTATNKEEELNEKVAEMQVNDNREATAQKPADREQPVAPEEADRAATKIQAGFKGYKTRKELEGKLGGSSGSGGGQGSGVPAAGSAAGSQQEGKEQ